VWNVNNGKCVKALEGLIGHENSMKSFVNFLMPNEKCLHLANLRLQSMAQMEIFYIYTVTTHASELITLCSVCMLGCYNIDYFSAQFHHFEITPTCSLFHLLSTLIYANRICARLVKVPKINIQCTIT